MMELKDPKVVVDLRDHNPGRPPVYGRFFDEVGKYVNNVVETAVHERRHESVTYLAKAMSISHLLNEVKKRLPPDTSVQSKQWLRLQFWPKNPTSKASLQYTRDLEVKYMVQQRQLRKPHVDVHYAAAYFKYLKEYPVDFRDHFTMFCVDDKHKVKVGEPGCPVAAVDRGRQVLVGLNEIFQVADHDFTKLSLTPSVCLEVDVPKDLCGSFYRGTVHVGLKDSVFQPSSPPRHAVEQKSIIGQEPKEILLLYSDGGPDHRVNYLSVQLSIIALFLDKNYDAVIAVRTPPGHSWMNPCERIMSMLNLSLQSVGVMRKALDSNLETHLMKCNSMQNIRDDAKKVPTLKDAVIDSVQQPILLLTELFTNLSLKEVPLKSTQVHQMKTSKNLLVI
ncbi:uncharacterized protein LOC124291542 isoform X1 [Haliotis rubra]|uniref:uncharacterized protein LOC124291542 isoform X1 n=1 Tax=Haliotis rubra TaxID=36100 RepID=UPI001EE566DD|nr:uncharacterized protein LOC124291542 isoform X1 [Haliotis rubra]XP_046584514.1 uncharacterized protein LOC124291542 isoform X1 [Haliotis rubra]XP_046584515.1 uncharacterized protein LOC124291542 isoform X1 [Haliotis rubra]